jgi:hypothetical protein
MSSVSGSLVPQAGNGFADVKKEQPAGQKD